MVSTKTLRRRMARRKMTNSILLENMSFSGKADPDTYRPVIAGFGDEDGSIAFDARHRGLLVHKEVCWGGSHDVRRLSAVIAHTKIRRD